MAPLRATERKQDLFESLERLRRVERRLPPDRDLVAVRVTLERELGETVSRRLAARLLGVSHTALARWIAAGDVPLVETAAGSRGVPVDALLELREAVAEAREANAEGGRPLEPVMRERRARARRVDAARLVPPPAGDGDPHTRARRRSLAYHRALARGLSQRMVDDARRQLWRWRIQGRIDARHADRWEELLRQPVAAVRAAIAADDEDADDLRQNSPFAGMLSEPERATIFEQVR